MECVGVMFILIIFVVLIMSSDPNTGSKTTASKNNKRNPLMPHRYRKQIRRLFK